MAIILREISNTVHVRTRGNEKKVLKLTDSLCTYFFFFFFYWTFEYPYYTIVLQRFHSSFMSLSTTVSSYLEQQCNEWAIARWFSNKRERAERNKSTFHALLTINHDEVAYLNLPCFTQTIPKWGTIYSTELFFLFFFFPVFLSIWELQLHTVERNNTFHVSRV